VADPDAQAPPGFGRRGEEEVFAGHVFRVVQGHFSDPEGRPFDRSIVRHPGAVAVVAVDTDGTATLVRQLRAAVWEAVLEIPAGTRDVDGEPPERTARRELAEEAGLDAEQMTPLAVVYNSPGYSDQRTHIFLATGLTTRATDRAGVEERWMTTERVALDDVEAMLADGRLVDQTTVLALLLARGVLAGRS
jgi:ADP-ribose pyrophosphatase